MKKRNITIVVICLLVVAGAFCVSLPHRIEKRSDQHRSVHQEAAEDEQPTGHQHGAPPAPAETKEASEGQQPEETPTVEIPTDKQQLIGVRTVKAAMQPLHRVIRTVGPYRVR